jgi:hypothetical protein
MTKSPGWTGTVGCPHHPLQTCINLAQKLKIVEPPQVPSEAGNKCHILHFLWSHRAPACMSPGRGRSCHPQQSCSSHLIPS